MKTKRLLRKIIVFSLAAFFLSAGSRGYAQALRDEVQQRPIEAVERDTEADLQRQEPVKGKLYKHLKLSYGYDTNPLLSSDRRGDDYESLRLGMDYRRTFADRNQYGLSFNVTQQNYNEITQLSNTLANFNVDYKRALTKKYILGAGQKLSLAYYDKDASSRFTLSTSYLNFQHRISAKLFHKIQYEFGLKYYSDSPALASSLTTYKDDNRRDISQAAVYSVGYTMDDRFSTTLNLRYERDNSNSDFQDYYDYDAYDFTPRLYYKMTKALTATLGYSFKFKKYKNRMVGTGLDEQLDRISRVEMGLNYELNERHSFTLNYNYNGNDSNNYTSDYAGSSIEVGWRYNF